jgi:hypothetical protein
MVRQEPEAPARQAMPAKREAGSAHHRPVRLNQARLPARVFEFDMAYRPNRGGRLKLMAAILEAWPDTHGHRARRSMETAGTQTMRRYQAACASISANHSCSSVHGVTRA